MLRAAVLAALIAAPPAQGATSLAHVDDDSTIALAGDTALFDRHDSGKVTVFRVALDASARARAGLHVQADDPVVTLSGSAQRAGISVVNATPGTDFTGRVFSGPAAGPWPELDAGGGGFVSAAERVDGDNVFVIEANDTEERVTVREAGGPPRTIETTAAASLPVFAGDMEAEITGDHLDTLLVRNWRTGAQRELNRDHALASVDVRADGTALMNLDGGGVERVAPDGTVTEVSRYGGPARFAGDDIVYANREGLVDLGPAGPRKIGVPTENPDAFDADDRHVLWSANGCLFVADLTAPAVPAPDPGLCTRTEVQVVERYAIVRPDRRVPVRLHCVAAPGACKGTLRAAIRGHKSRSIRFSVPAGRSGNVSPRLPAAALRGNGLQPVDVTIDTVDPDGRHRVATGGFQARVR